MSFTLAPISSCPDCGAPIYGPEAVPEESVDKVKVLFTCNCSPIDDEPDETIETLEPDEKTEG